MMKLTDAEKWQALRRYVAAQRDSLRACNEEASPADYMLLNVEREMERLDLHDSQDAAEKGSGE